MSTLMLRLAVAMIIAVALGLCSIDQAVHSTKKVAEFIGITGAVDYPTKRPPRFRRPGAAAKHLRRRPLALSETHFRGRKFRFDLPGEGSIGAALSLTSPIRALRGT
jgi:hypothetical protein